ncbi:hypothetical protein D6D10_02276 [Aureobasidium pullulans]|uniref:Uncharacterized protein n=1 Tax=Aureobasidium pullulans TaxID=5580 RepID=A0A4S9F467_AURPU|nr:hypothetical protein D6D10_02276 [Aureobasidium pullulans]
MFLRNDYLNNIWKRHFSCKKALDQDDYLKVVRPDLISLERLELLEVLLKERPGLAVCDYCQKMRPRRKLGKVCPGRPGIFDPWYRLCGCQPFDPDAMYLHYSVWRIYLSFEHFRQIMYRRRLGEAHGSAPEVIPANSDWRLQTCARDYRTAWMEKIEMKPQFVGRNLVLHVTQRILLSRKYLASLNSRGLDRSHLIDLLTTKRIKTCHCRDPANVAELKARTASLLDMDNDSTFEVVREEPNVEKCAKLSYGVYTRLAPTPTSRSPRTHPGFMDESGTSRESDAYTWNQVCHAIVTTVRFFPYPSQQMQLTKSGSAIDHPSLADFNNTGYSSRLAPEPVIHPAMIAIGDFMQVLGVKLRDQLISVARALGDEVGPVIFAGVLLILFLTILAVTGYIFYRSCCWIGIMETAVLAMCLITGVYFRLRRYWI